MYNVIIKIYSTQYCYTVLFKLLYKAEKAESIETKTGERKKMKQEL